MADLKQLGLDKFNGCLFEVCLLFSVMGSEGAEGSSHNFLLILTNPEALLKVLFFLKNCCNFPIGSGSEKPMEMKEKQIKVN